MSHDRPAPADFEAWNEEMARRYDPERYYASASPVVRLIERRRAKRIVRLADVRPGARVLDLGCGPGHMLAMLADVPCELWGLDLSRYLLDRASARLGVPWSEADAPGEPSSGRGRARVRLVRGDVQAPPAQVRRAGPFDVVLCSEVLEHLPDPRRVLEQAAALLRPGGRLVASVPNERLIDTLKAPFIRLGLMGLLFPGVATKMGDEWHLHEFDLARLRADAAGLPLREREVRGVPSRALPIRWVVAFDVA